MPKRRQPSPHRPSGSSQRSTTIVDGPSARVDAARRMLDAGRQADAFRLFADAMRQEPNNVRTYVMAARAYAERYDFDRFEATLEKLVRRAPRHPGVHHLVGETFGMINLPARALESYERAARLPGASAPTWIELALLYERAHRLDEAEAMIERTLKAGVNQPAVLQVRGRIVRRQQRLAEAEAIFRQTIAQAPESPWACQAWSELALMKDREGDYAGAVEAVEHAKRIHRAREAPHLQAAQQSQRQMQALIEGVSRADFTRWREETSGLPVQRTALLTGFPRSGTTLLEQVLDAHPQLVSSEERDYLGSAFYHTIAAGQSNAPLLEAMNRLGVDELDQQRQRYIRFMSYLLGEPIGDRVHLDKNPAYNLSIPLMLRLFPETRLLIALRDPRDVVLSCYLQYMPLNAVSVSFLEVERTARRYALDMNAWLKLREIIDAPWRQIRYEDVVADLAGQTRLALDTLGLEWDEGVLDYRRRLTNRKQVTSPTYEAVAEPIYTRAIGRWKNYERHLEPAFGALEPFLREFGYA